MPIFDDEPRNVAHGANHRAEKSSAMCRYMLDAARVQFGTTWNWQPGRASRASEAASGADADRDRVHWTLKRVAKARALLDAQEAEALREAQRVRLWERFGYTSLVDYMQRELGYTARAAVDRVALQTRSTIYQSWAPRLRKVTCRCAARESSCAFSNPRPRRPG